MRKHNKKKATEINSVARSSFGESAGVRTRDPNIKSVVLYLLSYGFSDSKISFWWCKDSKYFYSSKIVDKNIVFTHVFAPLLGWI